MADDAAMAAAAALIGDAVDDQDPYAEALGPAPVQAGNLYEGDEATQVVEQSAPVEAEELPSFNFNADTSGLDWLEEETEEEPEEDFTVEPSFDDEPVAAPAAETWDEDEEKQQLRRQLAQLQKKAEWEREQRVKSSQKKWREEAERRFPLSDPATINATSRRGMLREAKLQHDRVFKKIEPLTALLEKERAATLAETRQEARQEAAKAWGRPAAGVGQTAVTTPPPVGNPRFERGKGLVDVIKSKLASGEYGNI